MTRKLFRLAAVGLFGGALLAPLGGCDSVGTQDRPTIDTSTPIKAPAAPTTQTVEPIKKK